MSRAAEARTLQMPRGTLPIPGLSSKQSRFRKYELGFDAYFTALEREFSVQELVRSPSADRVQRIYAIEPSTSGE